MQDQNVIYVDTLMWLNSETAHDFIAVYLDDTVFFKN